MTSAKIRATVTVVFLLSASFLAVSSATAHCGGKHTGNHPHCDNGGGTGDGGTAAPVFVYVKPANGSDRVFLANADGTSATQIFVGTKFSFSQQPALYGDASGGEVLINDFSNLYRIAYSVNNGVINVDSTDRIQDRDIGPTTHTSNPDWSPDGSRLVIARLVQAGGLISDLLLLDLASGEYEVLEESAPFNGVRFLPDSERVALFGTQGIEIMELSTRQREAIYTETLGFLAFSGADVAPDGSWLCFTRAAVESDVDAEHCERRGWRSRHRDAR